MVEHKILAEAEFTKKACTYWLLTGALALMVIVVGIPLLPFWFIFGMMITGKYLEHMGCTLTEKTLIVKKGMFNRIEKTIPLEKITDLGLKQGPIMRALDLHALTVETAGSSGGGAGGALVSLIGIKDTIDFRNQVLAQRDLLNSGKALEQAPPSTISGDNGVLDDIRDTLHRIEDAIKQS